MMYPDFMATIYLPVTFMLLMTAGFASAVLLFAGAAVLEARRPPQPQPVPVTPPRSR